MGITDTLTQVKGIVPSDTRRHPDALCCDFGMGFVSSPLLGSGLELQKARSCVKDLHLDPPVRDRVEL